MCHGTENAAWQEHKSPGSFPETLGFIELAAPGADNLQPLGMCMAVPCALEGLQPLKSQPEPTARNQVLFGFFSFLCSRTQQTALNSLIFLFPPNISKAQGPIPALLSTGLGFSHCDCLEELDETKICQINAKTNPQGMTQNSSMGF